MRSASAGALAVFMAAMAVYLPTLCPTVSPVGDSGEMATAAALLGVPHPPGYSLFVLLSHPFTWLPFGEMAWRVNLAAATFGALAAAVAFAAMAGYGWSRWTAAAASLSLAFSLSVWQMSASSELRTLYLLAAAILVALLLAWSRQPTSRSLLYGMALTAGLGLCAHYNFILIVAAVLVALLWYRPSGLPLWPTLGGVAVCFLAGLLPLLSLPLRAARDPYLNWGNPSTAENLWWVLARQGYGGLTSLLAPQAGSWSFADSLSSLGHTALLQFTPALLVLALVGWILMWRRDWRLAAFLTLLVVLLGPVFLAWERPSSEAGLWPQVARQFLPLWMAAAFLLAEALEALGRLLSRWRLSPLVLAVVALPLSANWALADLHDSRVAQEFGHQLLADLPPQSALFVSTDMAVAAVTYVQGVERFRLDVLVVPAGFIHSRWFQEQLRRRFPDDAFDFSGDLTLHLLPRRPVFADIPGPLLADRAIPLGLTSRIAASPAEVMAADPREVARGFERVVERLSPGTLESVGRMAWDSDSFYIGSIVRQYALGCNELGVSLARRGWDGDAEKLLTRAVTLYPRLAEAHFNLGLLQTARQKFDRAAEEYRLAVQSKPDYVDALTGLADACARLGRTDEARLARAELDRLRATRGTP